MGCHRDIGRGLAVAVSALVLTGCGPEPHRLNAILISVDTLRADHLGAYGYERPTSPHLDALAGQGVRFARAYSQASWTLPSHMSVMTSQYPNVHGVTDDGLRLGESAITLAEVLAERGYDTAAIVTWVYVSEIFGFDQGFGSFDLLVDATRFEWASGGGAFDARRVTDRAIAWVRQERSAPFFLFLHYFEPHIDYSPPPPFDTLFDRDYEGPADGTYVWAERYIAGVQPEPARVHPRDRRHMEALYDGEIRYVDEQIGRLLEAIDEQVGLDDCLIVFIGDHGEEFDEHGSMQGHGLTLYEEVLHVPLLIRLPARDRADTVVEDPVALIDVAPTILDALGVLPPPAFQGRSLARYWNGSIPEPKGIYAESNHFNIVRRAVRGRRYKLIHTEDTGRNTFGIPVTPGYELYDLDRDPREQSNIYAADSPVARYWTARLEAFAASSAEAPPPEESEIPEADLELLRGLGYLR